MKVETQMNKLKLSEKLIQDAVNILPTLTWFNLYYSNIFWKWKTPLQK
jgi:hypothetical protein